MAVLPENVGAGQRSVAAQCDLDRRRKPAKIEAVAVGHQKCGFREIHFTSHVAHPAFFARRG
jgi:hypothetical protein